MEYLPIIIILIGIGLLVAEIFIPSFGISGGLGIVAIVTGVILTSDTIMGAIVMTIAVLVVTVILMYLAYRFVVSKNSKLVLTENLKEDEGYEELRFFVGKQGVAITPLRPAGTIELEGVRLDAITRGDFIEKGTEIVVSIVDGKKIIVEKKHN